METVQGVTARLLHRGFYARDTAVVARELLGKVLVRRIPEGTLSGIITETEAYKGEADPASHAYRGITKRNRAMFGQVGRVYVYFTYGMHYCVNVVARDDKNSAGAVLIRAVRPETGIEIMRQNRHRNGVYGIADGPAKLTQAMQIGSDMYGQDLTEKSALYITHGEDCIIRIRRAPRIGISRARDKRWNFSIVDR